MIIKRVEVENFKSFKKLKVDLGNFTVVIGANASGKSNFASIFEFLRDISTWGLENAISLQGGAEYLRNMNIGISKPLSVKVVYSAGFIRRFLMGKGLMEMKISEEIYEFALKFNKNDSSFKVAKDKVVQNCDFFQLKGEKRERIGKGKIIISHSNGKINFDLGKIPLEKRGIFPIEEREFPDDKLLLETPHIMFLGHLRDVFGEISIYDFDPKLSKQATPIIGKAELEKDGSNLAIILKNIVEREERKRKLFNLVKDVLPFVEDIDVEKFADKSLLFKLKESYFKIQYLPASLISDGTINITALIVALYFEKKPFVIIEEPERNIHPSLISKIVEMMRDASQTQKKQIVVTTHNPEFVKHAELENILLVSRDENGFSTVSRPADKERVKIFLENEIGIEELYIQNLLEV